MSADPLGLLDRIPELEPLVQADAKLRDTIARGSAHGAYRRLWWMRLTGKVPHEQRQSIDAVLAHRRLFAEQLRSTPAMITFNGVGARLYGESERDPANGTYIATHYVTVVFVPIFPLGSYLVADGSSARGRSWHFIARAPFSGFHHFWRSLFGLFALSAIGAGAYSTFHSSRYQDVYFVNGLTVDVDVAVEGGPTIHVKALTKEQANVRTGNRKVEVKANGKQIDSDLIKVQSGMAVSAYNVLGVGLVYDQTVYYSASQPVNDSEPAVHCGEHFVELAKVDYSFVDPPKEIQVPEKSGQTGKQHADFVAKPHACVSLLATEGKTQAAAALFAKEDEAEDFESKTHEQAVDLLCRFGEVDEAVALAKKGLEAHDDSVPLHRTFQDAMRVAERNADLVDIYTKRRDAAPDSADAAYLLARVKENPDGKTFIELRKRFPKHAFILRAAVYDYFVAGDNQGAVQAMEDLRALDPAAADEMIRIDVEARVSLGKGPEALTIIEKAFSKAEDRNQKVAMATLYGYVARVTGQPVDKLLGKLVAGPEEHGFDASISQARVLVGAPAQPKATGANWDDQDRRLIEIETAALTDPGKALSAVDKAKDTDFLLLAPETWQLLYCEAERQQPGGKRAARLATVAAPAAKVYAAYLKSGSDADLGQADSAVRAAAHFIRSRSNVDKAEKEKLLAAVKKEDVLQTSVTQAMNRWPAP